ncbi:GGDEF domain-containing protein [Kineococcus sp. SYSU DK003]|uniref:GGDEF domain-containing protein n=1 Tax=Kineococcus sp. SYSU DK003 TaxID=3383124 RepID=UPI003D7CB201
MSAPPWRRPDLLLVAALVLFAPVYLSFDSRFAIDLGLVIGSVLCCAVLVLAGLRRRPFSRWLPWVLAHALFAVVQVLFLRLSHLGLSTFPTPADAVYLVGDLVLFVAIVRLVPGPAGGRSRGLVLETAVVTASVTVLLFVFSVLPAANGDGPVLARLVSIAYPVVDLAIIHLLARSAGGGTRPPAFWLLSAGLLATVAADVSYTVVTYLGTYSAPAWINYLWMARYALVAAATLAPSASRLGLRPAGERADDAQLRLPVLALAAVLPSAAVVAEVAIAGEGPERLPLLLLATGSVLVLALLLARVGDLLRVVRTQAAVVERLADTDPLTGLPNRRAWDAEVARTFVAARATGAPVQVAIVDLDHFKEFNDTRGHDGGDALLVAAAAAWRAALPGAFIARWGGEEFTVLLLGADAEQAALRLRGVHAGVPDHQTCSIGVAQWNGSEVPPAALARADKALYRAKGEGRDRTVVDDGRRATLSALPA